MYFFNCEDLQYAVRAPSRDGEAIYVLFFTTNAMEYVLTIHIMMEKRTRIGNFPSTNKWKRLHVGLKNYRRIFFTPKRTLMMGM